MARYSVEVRRWTSCGCPVDSSVAVRSAGRSRSCLRLATPYRCQGERLGAVLPGTGVLGGSLCRRRVVA